ncbi:MAG: hypothetical protein IH600_07235, partial [Bacteroidetes bacterium]|nr:hypothetical protein [Bacteroidota bacterium]
MSRLLAMIAGADTAQGHDTPLSRRETAVFLFSVTAFMALAFYLHLEYLLFLVIVGALGALLVFQSPVAWIAASILGFIPVFWNIEAGLTPPEIGHTFLFYGGLIWWFFHRIVIARKPLRWTLGGILSAVLFLQLALMGPLSIGYGADPYVWLRELVIMSTVLMLVPISHECDTRAKQYVVGGALFLTLSALSLKNIYMYKQKVLEAVWLWQVGASRATETFYLVFVLAVLAAAPVVSARGKGWLLLWSSIFALGVTATVISFYRTVWVGALAGYFFMGVLMGRVFWKRALKYAGIALVLLAMMYPVFLSDVVPLDVMWASISSRFESIGSYRTDVSVKNRDAEARTIIEDIGGNWLLGKGLSTTVHFTKLTSMTSIEPTWTHNGYAWVLNHFGILGALLLFGSWLSYVALGWRTERRLRSTPGLSDDERFRLRTFTAAAVAVILATFMISLTINQFMSHESGLVFG